MSLIYFTSFATSNYNKTSERIKSEALSSEFFDNVICYNENDISEFIEEHKNFISTNSRGYGYWIWKPYYIKKILSSINDGDFLIHLDIGCTINKNGFKRFKEYLKLCEESPYKNITMQYTQYKENQWTKNDIFQYFNTNEGDKLSGQIPSGFWIIQKNNLTAELVDKYLEGVLHYNLINDSPSKSLNCSEFIENRHDQSIFSCLIKKCGTTHIENEFDLDGEGVEKYINRSDYINYPFWATRLKF